MTEEEFKRLIVLLQVKRPHNHKKLMAFFADTQANKEYWASDIARYSLANSQLKESLKKAKNKLQELGVAEHEWM